MEQLVILHLIPSLSSGGAERQLVDVVCNTSKRRLRHVVCCWENSTFFGPQIEASGSRVIDLNVDKKHPWFAVARKIDPLVKEIQPDIIHSWLYDAGIIARIVKVRNRRINLITSLQSPHYEPDSIRAGNFSKRKVGLLRWMDRITARIADPFFVACSRFVAESAAKWQGVKPSRISVIYNSVDPKTLAPRDTSRVRRELGIAPGDFVYLSVGRLDNGKGFRFLIDAFARVQTHVPEAKLILVGDGPDKEMLQSRIDSLGINDKVVLAGRRNDVGTCLEVADVFVFPTLFEGLPLALIEAMAKRLPCIASEIPVLREVIEHGSSGLLVEARSIDGWAKSMADVYSDADLRTRLGKAAEETIKARFYSNVLMPQWERIYEQIARRDSITDSIYEERTPRDSGLSLM